MDLFANRSPLQEERLKQSLELPFFLRNLTFLEPKEKKTIYSHKDEKILSALFSNLQGSSTISFEPGKKTGSRPLTVAVVLSGGPAPGGHNVILGIFEALKQLHPNSRLWGFLKGPSGILDHQAIELTQEKINAYRNTGGFDLIGSGRTKIETDEQLQAALKTAQSLKLDGLVIIGGDDSNTNAAILAEFFIKNKCSTKVIGVPKTIDGDLKNDSIEISFGFDTACKVYSEMIGNLQRDAISSRKYYHFVKLMGRSASHIALECALQTHPNLALIGEEIASLKMTFGDIVSTIAEMIEKRESEDKNYGVILIPEGLVEFIPELKSLLQEVNILVSKVGPEKLESNLSDAALSIWKSIPESVRKQLLMDLDPHGNIQVSHISTEQLLIDAVKKVLSERKKLKGKFHPVSHFFGYEGRSAFPSIFDAHYCYALGFVSALLIHHEKTGYLAVIQHLSKPIEEWTGGGIPLTSLMAMEERKGKLKPVIQKAYVDLKANPFKCYVSHRDAWKMEDHYRFPGPIQYLGSFSVSKTPCLTLLLEHGVSLAAY